MTQEELRKKLSELARTIASIVGIFEDEVGWELSDISVSRLNVGTVDNPTKSLPIINCEINMRVLGK